MFWRRIKDTVRLAIDFFRSRDYLHNFLILTLFFGVFFIVYFHVSTLASNDDHFLHFRFAEQILHNGYWHSFTDFSSIYFSKMQTGGYFVYYNFLFYLVILPFAVITPLTLGIKLYAVCAVSFAFWLLYLCLKHLAVRNPFIWTLIFIAITNVNSIWRFFLSRPYALAPSLLLLLLVFLYKKNYVGVFAISFIYFYWHSATFFLPLCVAIGYVLIEKFYGEDCDYKNTISSLVGTVIAVALTFIVSHGFLSYMHDVIFGEYIDTIISQRVPIAEGSELYPTDFFNFIQANVLIFALFATMFSVDVFNYLAYRYKKILSSEYFASLPPARRVLQTTILILTALFFLGTVAVSARFGDYFTFFAALYIAFSLDYVRRVIDVSGSAVLRRGVMIGCVIVLIYLFVSNMLFLEDRLAHGSNGMELYQSGMWLARNSNPGDVVFLTNWSTFTELYYYSPRDNYSMGLEPRFLYTYSPKLYWLATHISNDGYVCDVQACDDLKQAAIKAFVKDGSSLAWAKDEGDKIATVLVGQFKASYVIAGKEYLVLNYIMDHNSHFTRELYDNQYGYAVYKVN